MTPLPTPDRFQQVLDKHRRVLPETTFTHDATENCVYWGSIRLSDDACEKLLDLFDTAGAAAAFNELYSAHLASGGIARVTSLRAAA